MYKSQNNEVEVVLNYFSSIPGKKCVLSIGENDGQTFSNSYDLIANGWDAILVEPSPKAFDLLKEVHKDNKNVVCLNYGIANETGSFTFNESGSHKHIGGDIALLSSLIDSEMDRWGDDVSFEKITANFKTFDDMLKDIEYRTFDFISIDAEGYDYEILKQIDLDKFSCKCLCIEYNSKPNIQAIYEEYASRYNMRLISKNAENVIFVK